MFKTSKKPKKLLALSLALVVGISLATFAFGSHAYAADEKDAKPKDNICKTNADGSQSNPDPSKPCIADPGALKSTPDSAAKKCNGGDCSGLITKYVNPFIKLLTWIVGIAVVISIVVGGIQFSSAGGDPGKAVAARKRITNSIIGLLAYLFLFAFLQWLLPGGIV
ncbi:MAG TPA: pilin [Candidatus Saccharimonadales bacterium]|nr:pilin [Candidatus Saccharimonadales bacterium]